MKFGSFISKLEADFFIPGIIKPDNVIYFNDEVEIIQEKAPVEYLYEACDNIDLLALEKPENEEERLDSFDILRKEKPDNIIDQNYFVSIEATPKKTYLEIDFGDEVIFENELRPDIEIQSLQGFDLFKKQKPLNIIQITDEIELLGELLPQLNLTLEEIDLFTINKIEKPKNKPQRVSEVKILKKLLKGKKPSNYIQTTNNIKYLGKAKENAYIIEFPDEMIIEGLEIPINKIQRTQEVKIIKRTKIKAKNTKQKSSEFQIIKKIKPKKKK